MKIKRKTGIKSIIPVSSMSDIAFLLLIFLMLSSIMNMKKGPTINPPFAKEVSTPEERQKFEIIVDQNGNYFHEGSYRLAEEITTIFSSRVLANPQLMVEISADENTTYDKIDTLKDALQAAEAYSLLFVSKKIKDEPKP